MFHRFDSSRAARLAGARPIYLGSRTFGLVIAGAALGVSMLLAPGCSKKGAGEGAPGGGFEMPPTPVETATVQVATVRERFDAVGTIEAGEAITVVSEIDGVITRLPFQEGSRVGTGALLAQLDDVQLKAEMERAEAVRDQARNRFARVKQIVEQDAGAKQDLDDANAGLKVSEANYALAKSAYDKAHITAPWDGLVGARRVSQGAYIRAGEAITDLAQIRRIRVNFSAPERYLGSLVKGSPVSIRTSAFPGVELVGAIDVVEPVIDADTRAARIVARVDNPEERFRPGMSCEVSVVLRERPNALTVSNEAVFVEGNESLVYLIGADNSVARTPITLGTRAESTVEVTAGLKEGDRVVRAGHQKLYPGAKVMPVDAAAAGSQAAPGQAAPGTEAGQSPAAGESAGGGAAPEAGH